MNGDMLYSIRAEPSLTEQDAKIVALREAILNAAARSYTTIYFHKRRAPKAENPPPILLECPFAFYRNTVRALPEAHEAHAIGPLAQAGTYRFQRGGRVDRAEYIHLHVRQLPEDRNMPQAVWTLYSQIDRAARSAGLEGEVLLYQADDRNGLIKLICPDRMLEQEIFRLPRCMAYQRADQEPQALAHLEPQPALS